MRLLIAGARRSVMSLLAQVQEREPDPACRAELANLRAKPRAPRQPAAARDVPTGPGKDPHENNEARRITVNIARLPGAP
jgi:hypothetical protein